MNHVFEILFWFLAGLTSLRLLIAGSNYFSPIKLPHAAAPDSIAKISILIPARNEAERLPALLQQISAFTHPQLEWLVYDDESTDGTADLVKVAIQQDPRGRLLPAQPLPEAWLGKSHACYQLAQHAQGDYLLFLDADVRLHESALHATLAYLQQHQLQLLSVFPQQITRSWGEMLLVPFMHHLLLTWLPLLLVKNTKWSGLAVANGQFMLFDGQTYRQYQWHQQVKHQIVEDVAIMRLLKAQSLRGMALLAAHPQLQCRMYQHGEEALAGFAKTLVPGFQHQPLLLLFYALVTGWIWLLLAIKMPLQLLILLPALVLTRIFVTRSAGDSLPLNLGLGLVQWLSWQWLLLRALYDFQMRRLKWKDRFVK
ncbi:MAG: glycosyltransferase family A protein [Sphingobacteriaceae bacterium]|nr:glycosyltransferase family A protein [Sphingobacteriaceae bacterium]